MTSAVAAILSWSQTSPHGRCRVDSSARDRVARRDTASEVRHRRAQPSAARRPGDPRISFLPGELRQPRSALHRLQRARRTIDQRLRRTDRRMDRRASKSAGNHARRQRHGGHLPGHRLAGRQAAAPVSRRRPREGTEAFRRRRHAAGGRRTPRIADRAFARNRAARAAGSARTLRSDAGTARRLASRDQHRDHRRRLRDQGRTSTPRDGAAGSPSIRRGLLAGAFLEAREDPRVCRCAARRTRILRTTSVVRWPSRSRAAIASQSKPRRWSGARASRTRSARWR